MELGPVCYPAIPASSPIPRHAGAEILGDLKKGGDGYAWQHFRAPDGKVFELCCDPSL